MPLFGCIILGLRQRIRWPTQSGLDLWCLSEKQVTALYLLHFNFWNLIHDTHVLDRVGLSRFDPWISYFLLIVMALLALYFIEKPMQRQLRKWMRA